MKLSVVVCTYNRAHALKPCLDSVNTSIMTASFPDAEIIVVDNASTDSTANILQDWANGCAIPLQILYEAKKGLAAARNCGIRAAKGDIIAFTDDDCRMDNNYITDLLKHFAQDEGLILRGGRIELGDKDDLPLTIKTNRLPMRWNKSTPSAKYALMSGEAICGCNMAMPRGLIEKVGLFDERFGTGTAIPAGEDTDYFLRTYLAGITIEYVPDMLIFHWHGRKTPADARKLLQNYTIANGALNAKYLFKAPSLSRGLYWDIRNSLLEIFQLRNNYLPQWNFSCRNKLMYSLKGTLKYVYVNLG